MSPAKRNLLLSRLPAGVVNLLAKAVPTPLARMSVEEMSREAALGPALDPDGAAPPSRTLDAVLLTGATGFLGAFLLEALLQRTSATVYCLVRAPQLERATERIQENLRRYRREADADRICPILGDLALPGLGLAADVGDPLADRIDAIFHCGAVVKWSYPYRALKGANVDGTRAILQLAVRRRLKPVHFISTVGVFSSPEYASPVVPETEPLEQSGPLYVGYAQSKWVAERMVTQARDRGLPVWIYRPNLGSDSATGVFNPHDHVSLLLRASVRAGLAPELPLRVSGMPVDCAARAIVDLSQNPSRPGSAYHLVNPRDLAWGEFCDWFARQGYPLRPVSCAAWRQAALTTPGIADDHALLALLPLVSDQGLQYARLPRFDCAHTFEELRRAGIPCPPLDDALLSTYLRHYEETAYLGSHRKPGN